MINYEKLKMAHELADKYSKKNDNCCMDITLEFGYTMPQFTVSADGIFERYIWIDDLISKLEQLTKSEPKFKVGDTVWVIKKDKPIMADIINIEDGVCHVSYDGGHSHIEEKYIYSSRKELIDAQIKHWQSLKEPEEKPPIYDMKSFVSSEEKEPDKVFHKPKINDEDFEKFLKGFADKRHNQCEHDNNGEYLKPDGFPQYTRKCIKCGQFY